MGAVASGLVALLVAACSLLPPPAGIQGRLPGTDGWPDLPVTVVDHAGIVRAIAPGAVPAIGDGVAEPLGGVTAIPGRDDAVLLTWLGGACDDRSIITIEPDGDRYRIQIESPSSATSCSAVGIIRRLELSLTERVGADAFRSP